MPCLPPGSFCLLIILVSILICQYISLSSYVSSYQSTDVCVPLSESLRYEMKKQWVQVKLKAFSQSLSHQLRSFLSLSTSVSALFFTTQNWLSSKLILCPPLLEELHSKSSTMSTISSPSLVSSQIILRRWWNEKQKTVLEKRKALATSIPSQFSMFYFALQHHQYHHLCVIHVWPQAISLVSQAS